jgi:hypothetical protein
MRFPRLKTIIFVLEKVGKINNSKAEGTGSADFSRNYHIYFATENSAKIFY